MSVAEFKALGAKAPKFGNKRVISAAGPGGMLLKFDSKLERDRYLHWRGLQAVGAVRWITRQVPFYLPGGIVYRVDLLIVETRPDLRLFSLGGVVSMTDHVRLEDCKGVLTRVSINKILQVEEIYGVTIDIVKRGKGRMTWETSRVKYRTELTIGSNAAGRCSA